MMMENKEVEEEGIEEWGALKRDEGRLMRKGREKRENDGK